VVKTVPINRQALSSKVQGPKPERSRAGVGYLGDSESPPPPESGLGSAVRTPSGDWGGAPEEVSFGAFGGFRNDYHTAYSQE